MANQTVMYARVSTSEQTLEHQQVQAEAAGFRFDLVISDHGVSGVNTKLCDRPEGRRLFDVLRDGDTLVVRWIDRLGRDFDDIRRTLDALLSKGITIRTVIYNMTFDPHSSDVFAKAMRNAMIELLAASAQSQAETIAQARDAGIASAKAQDPHKYLGRKPSYSQAQIDQILELHSQGIGDSEIARHVGISRNACIRIRNNPVHARATVLAWEGARARRTARTTQSHPPTPQEKSG